MLNLSLGCRAIARTAAAAAATSVCTPRSSCNSSWSHISFKMNKNCSQTIALKRLMFIHVAKVSFILNGFPVGWVYVRV